MDAATAAAAEAAAATLDVDDHGQGDEAYSEGRTRAKISSNAQSREGSSVEDATGGECG